MSEIKPGDTVQRRDNNMGIFKGPYTVVAVQGSAVWVNNDTMSGYPFTSTLADWEKVEPFFEPNTTYEFTSVTGNVTRFECVDVRSNDNGSRVAFGRYTYYNGQSEWTTREGFSQPWVKI